MDVQFEEISKMATTIKSTSNQHSMAEAFEGTIPLLPSIVRLPLKLPGGLNGSIIVFTNSSDAQLEDAVGAFVVQHGLKPAANRKLLRHIKRKVQSLRSSHATNASAE